MKNTDKEKIENFKVPKVINTDLTYYMQFGWKRLNERNNKQNEEIKYSRNVYSDKFPPQED